MRGSTRASNSWSRTGIGMDLLVNKVLVMERNAVLARPIRWARSWSIDKLWPTRMPKCLYWVTNLRGCWIPTSTLANSSMKGRRLVVAAWGPRNKHRASVLPLDRFKVSPKSVKTERRICITWRSNGASMSGHSKGTGRAMSSTQVTSGACVSRRLCAHWKLGSSCTALLISVSTDVIKILNAMSAIGEPGLLPRHVRWHVSVEGRWNQVPWWASCRRRTKAGCGWAAKRAACCSAWFHKRSGSKPSLRKTASRRLDHRVVPPNACSLKREWKAPLHHSALFSVVLDISLCVYASPPSAVCVLVLFASLFFLPRAVLLVSDFNFQKSSEALSF